MTGAPVLLHVVSSGELTPLLMCLFPGIASKDESQRESLPIYYGIEVVGHLEKQMASQGGHVNREHSKRGKWKIHYFVLAS